MAVTINASTSSGLIQTADTSGVLNIQTANTTALTIDASQNVGMGVTPSAWSQLKGFQLVGGSSVASQTNALYLLNNAFYDGSAWKYINTSAATRLDLSGGAATFYNAASGTAGNAITWTQAMTLDASGNLGVGVTSLTEKFEVAGSVNASTASTASFSTGNQRAFMDYVPGSTTARFGHLSGASGSTTGVMAMFTNGTERARIDSSGNFQFNSGYGSVAIAYGCRVWVSYNTVTSTSIRGSGGVSSLTDNGTGDTTINFSVTMPDTNYNVVGATKLADSTATTNNTMIVGPFSFATTSVRIYTTRPGDSLNDCAIVNISIFR